MKDLLRFFGKALFIVLYPILIVLAIVLGVLYFMNERDINQALDAYEEIYALEQVTGEPRDSVDDAMADIQTIISDFLQQIDQKNVEISELQDQVAREQKTGYGEMRGRVLGIIFSDSDAFNQYQRVCAQAVANENKQYCVSVAAVQGEYTLAVPEGEYFVFAQVQDDEPTAKAYYTEFVSCSKDESEEVCEESLSETNIQVSVASGDVVTGVDPTDWRNTQNVGLVDQEDTQETEE